MGARQGLPGSLAARVSYLLEPKNWLIVTVVGVGWSRVAVRDHSWLQVAGGSVLGAAAAALAHTAF